MALARRKHTAAVIITVAAIAALALWLVLRGSNPGVLQCHIPEDGPYYTPVCP